MTTQIKELLMQLKIEDDIFVDKTTYTIKIKEILQDINHPILKSEIERFKYVHNYLIYDKIIKLYYFNLYIYNKQTDRYNYNHILSKFIDLKDLENCEQVQKIVNIDFLINNHFCTGNVLNKQLYAESFKFEEILKLSKGQIEDQELYDFLVRKNVGIWHRYSSHIYIYTEEQLSLVNNNFSQIGVISNYYFNLNN